MATPHAIPAPTKTPTTTSRLDGQRLVAAAVTVIVAAAGVLSLDGQRRIADTAGWHGPYAWLLPVAVETYAALATWLYSRTRGADRARMAHQVLVGIAFSAGLNVCWHLIDGGVLHRGWPVTVGVSLVPTALVALALHLAAGYRVPTPAEADEHQADESAQPRRRYRVSRALVDVAAQALADAPDPRAVTGVELAGRDPKGRSVRAWQMALAEARSQVAG
ncbi:DUF2637 domain-containing protein [Actinomadura harenae]|uniref:DUF2637 domain-containing protein n=1 Tax=Actinomadura harenae TaxID=2483351 RepID=A0A3M2LR10_9ACTN|nr:DUF2637 domain-containing protein [Actinomadura harenae]RMI39889.1 DUF2637 domain-containing protein [Actinomadura harenae]